jgi:uncharacterized protein YoxC
MEELLKENAEQMRMLESMIGTIDFISAPLAQQTQAIAQLGLSIEQLNQTIAELKEKLGMKSKNSSKPPSSRGPAESKSLRKPSGKKPIALKGHKGSGLTFLPCRMKQLSIHAICAAMQ